MGLEILVFFSRYLWEHICEMCLFLLCESWDMSLFVCESCVTMCDLFVLCIWICACMDGSRCIFICFYTVCIHSLAQGLLESGLGAPGSRSDDSGGEVRLEESAHPFPTGGLGEGCRATRCACPC